MAGVFGIADVIGIAVGALCVIPMIDSMFPQKAERTTTIRIGAGLSTSDGQSLEGNVPGVRLFDVVGRTVAQKPGSDEMIADGSFKDIKLEADGSVGGRQSQYVSIVNGGNNALCISYISMTWPDGGKIMWSGDVGFKCGGVWYESATIMDAATQFHPKCIWIDGDGKAGGDKNNGIKTKGLGIHMTDFVTTDDRAAAWEENNDILCKSPPRFKMYEELSINDCLPYFSPELQYHTGTLTDNNTSLVLVDGAKQDCPPPDDFINWGARRSVKPKARRQLQGPAFAGKLITSNSTGHSATRLCESDTSVGPDFVAMAENKFCDMEAKKEYPLCDGTHREGCFDVNNNSLLPPKGFNTTGVNARNLFPRKEYHTVTHW